MQMSSVCPFARTFSKNAERSEEKVPEQRKEDQNDQSDEDKQGNEDKSDGEAAAPKCPLGYDSHSFKLGPFSCVICRSLLYQSSKCVPCGHKYCKACISRFQDCPLCGADIEKVEPDPDLQALVDQFIEGHARIKRPALHCSDMKGQEAEEQSKNVTYGDVSLERGSFLVQQAMRSRAMGDVSGAVTYYNESIEFLQKLPDDDSEVVHALSVSLNKIGDLKYYDENLSAARSYYSRSLDVRRKAVKDYTKLSSQILDVAVSLAKVADVNRGLGNEADAIEGFQEAVKNLECISLQPNEEASLEKRRLSVLEFLHGQLKESQSTNHCISLL